MEIIRETPQGNQIIARQLFLDCHRPIHHDLYGTDRLQFDDSVTELLIGDELAGKVLLNFINLNALKICRIRAKTKKILIATIENESIPRATAFNTHLDYEALIMDKLIDFDAVPNDLLITPSGKTFYDTHEMYRLLHQGFQLARHDLAHESSQWFSQFTDTWYFRNTCTRYRMIDLLQNYHPSMPDEFAKENIPEHDDLDSVVSAMKDIQYRVFIARPRSARAYKQFIRANPGLIDYAMFVREAMEYNEELRLLRSQSLAKFIGSCETGDPYGDFLDLVEQRKRRLLKYE